MKIKPRRSSWRPSQRQIFLSEILGPVAPNRVAPLIFLQMQSEKSKEIPKSKDWRIRVVTICFKMGADRLLRFSELISPLPLPTLIVLELIPGLPIPTW